MFGVCEHSSVWLCSKDKTLVQPSHWIYQFVFSLGFDQFVVRDIHPWRTGFSSRGNCEFVNCVN